jgi:hypothetical protein
MLVSDDSFESRLWHECSLELYYDGLAVCPPNTAVRLYMNLEALSDRGDKDVSYEYYVDQCPLYGINWCTLRNVKRDICI